MGRLSVLSHVAQMIDQIAQRVHCVVVRNPHSWGTFQPGSTNDLGRFLTLFPHLQNGDANSNCLMGLL